MRGIGEMARASGLSVSALRFYDGAGVLVPAEVDPDTGYRRYADDQLRAARLVASLRLVVGIGFYVWAFVKPPMPPTEEDELAHIDEGGPLHMGHDFAELHPDEVERRKRRHGHGH